MVTVTLKLEPFPVPTHVTVQMPAGKRQEGMKQPPLLALSDLSDETLAALIEEFTENVMREARPE